MSPTKIISVAAAVLLRSDGSYMLAQRPAGKAFEGYWEFPGGKLEVGETAHTALCRELQEELGITVTRAHPWLTRTYTYTHATVKLHFFRVYEWIGEPAGMEGQALSWQTPDALTVSPILPANAPILRALSLPTLYAISNAAELGNDVFLERLEQALIKGLRLVQIREAHLAPAEMLAYTCRAVNLAHRYGALVMVNSDIELAKLSDADGVHLTGKQLLECTTRPDMKWCSASCHNKVELTHAGRIGFDFAMLSPVLPTLSHPGAAHLGWVKFAEIIDGTTLPVYALGGLVVNDLGIAQEHGAHGIALLRQAWV